MTLAKLTATTAALLLSSTALMAQETQSQTHQSVFIDVGGTAVLVPMDVALEACGLDETGLQTAFQSRLEESGIDQTQFTAQMDSAMGMTGQGGAFGNGDTAAQDTAAADAGAAGTGDASGAAAGTEGTASADAGGATGDAAAADTATADASGAAAGDASGAAAGTQTTDTATADASGAAGQDATATGEVQNVESTAASTTGDAGATGTGNADPFIQLAACQIDQARATELQVDMTQTGSSLGFDAATLGIQSGTTGQ